MSTFADQGTGANAKPHLLTAYVTAWGGVGWRVTCPHEGPRDCGMVEECNGTPKDVEKWGCELYPEQPHVTPIPNGRGGWTYSPEDQEKWDAFEKAQDHWLDEVHGGYRRHRTEQCWFERVLQEDWFDSESYLEHIPEGTEIVSPLKVIVGHDGYDEDTIPLFKIWEEKDDADS